MKSKNEILLDAMTEYEEEHYIDYDDAWQNQVEEIIEDLREKVESEKSAEMDYLAEKEAVCGLSKEERYQLTFE